jgi:SAM-dependent methyltransferase
VAPRRSSRIHRGLTGARELVGTRYLADPGLRREYAEEIAPRTHAALGKILAELYGPDDAPPTRALDLGAGTGAAGAALRARFGAGLEIVAVDRVAGPGIVTADLARDVPPFEGRFDLIVAAHLLGELFLGEPLAERILARARRVLAWTRGFLEAGGTVILLEPALRETSRALLGVRDQLVAAGLSVVAPCFWRGPCPALARERDWCHDAAKVAGSRDRALHGFAASSARVDFSYLALRAEPAPAPPPAMMRVVSDPLVEKGRLRIFGCGSSGRHALVRLDRAASAANAAFGELARGDVVTVEGPGFASDGLRVTEATLVTAARRAR